MKPEDFVHLHCHSTFSLLEALPSPEEIVERAKELGQNAVGLADKGYTYGLVEFYQAAKKVGIKPILGLETYVAARTRFDQETGTDTKRYPLVLLAENEEGYRNLLALATQAALEGMYYKPRVDAELLTKYGKGLIALTGPIGGGIPQAALLEDGERITTLVDQYRSFFGPNNLYFELMDLPNVAGQSEVNQQLIAWGKKLNVPLVATCSSHYCRPGDSEAHDVLLCIQKNANVADTSRFTMRDSDFSMRPFEEMEQVFAHVPDALENTRTIADRCSVTLEFGKYRIPSFPVENHQTEESVLRAQCEEGLQKRYGAKFQKDPATEVSVRQRMEYELSIIKKMGFCGYFLIVADFVNEAKRRGIAVGPGRGSAAGSIVSYVLNITTLDPIEHGLLFERFLNPERISMPDIDIDFADTRRDEVLEYVRGKYGTDRVIQICTFGTLAARAAVKDVGRAYGVPFLEMNALAKLIPDRPGTLLKDAIETDELKVVLQSNETYRKIIETALKLEGKSRHVSVHACGVVITPEPAMHFTALQRAPKDENIIITQYDAKPLESLGLLKMDFLGLRNLTVIETALLIIERTAGKKLSMSDIPTDDPLAFDLLSRAQTTGVFQLESAGMRRYLKQLKPTRFEDIVAMCALYRPGPMDAIPDYIKRKHDPSLIKYEVPELKPFLEETYGIIVYQEQVQRVVQEFAGFSLGAGYLLIKAVAKKIPALLNEQRAKFLEGALAKGHKKQTAEKIFALIEPFTGYGFNKSHSACYARIAYETAYLKAHYPTAFMAALLSGDAADTDRIMIEIEECREMGIQVLPPDINESLRHFTAIEKKIGERPPPKRSDRSDRAGSEGEKAIRFGLTAIKGIGESSVLQIIAAREAGGKFKSIEDFACRVPSKVLNKKLLEALSKSGALDSLGERRTFVEHYESIVDFSKSCGDVSTLQADLFASSNAKMDAATIEFPKTEQATLLEKLQWEKETLGMYVSNHPLAGLKKYIAKKAQLIADLTEKENGKKVKLAGLVEGIKRITTKKGETMAVVLLEDPTGKIEVTLFPRVYAEFSTLLEMPDTVLVIGGTVDLRAGQLQLRADAIKRAALSTMITHAKQEGFFDEEEAKTGLSLTRKRPETSALVELTDEEGNIIAGETVTVAETKGEVDELFGPLGLWLMKGMPVEGLLSKLGFSAPPGIQQEDPASEQKKAGKESTKHEADEQRTYSTQISVHTITLPERAPKKLLLDLKKVLETFPGREKVQLKIGEQIIPLPLTINMSTVLEKRIDEVLALHALPSP